MLNRFCKSIRLVALILVMVLVATAFIGCNNKAYTKNDVIASSQSQINASDVEDTVSAKEQTVSSNETNSSYVQSETVSDKSENSNVTSSDVSSVIEEVSSVQQTVTEGDPNKKGIFSRRNVLVNYFYDSDIQSTIAYCLVLPRNYDSRNKYPVLLYLHGVGVEGSDGERHINLLSLMQEKAPNYLDNAILVAPQCPSGKSWNIYEEDYGYNGTLATVKRLLDSIAKQYSCDENRYYAVGYSFGGYGVLAMADYYNDLFAAVEIIAGWYDISRANRFINLPIWLHHGTADNVVNYQNSKSLYDEIIKQGSQKIKMSSYEGVAHNSYSSAFRDMTTYSWLFSQTK